MIEYRNPITRELMLSNTLVFYPKTAEESELIQRALFKLGAAWTRSGASVTNLVHSVENGICVNNGRIYSGLDEEDKKKGLRCKLAQLLPSVEVQQEEQQVPPRATLEDMFNKLSSKIDEQAEIIRKQQQMIEKLYDAHFNTFTALPKDRKNMPSKGAGS